MRFLIQCLQKCRLLKALNEKEGQFRSKSLFVSASHLKEAVLKTRDERDTVSMLGKNGEESHVSKHRSTKPTV